MSNKDALQRYEQHNVAAQRTGQAKTLLTVGAKDADECGQWYSPDAVRHILADAHAHYEAQVRQLGGLARPDAQPPTDRSLQLMALIEQYGGAKARLGHGYCTHDGSRDVDGARRCADLYNRINAMAQEMAAEAAKLRDDLAVQRSVFAKWIGEALLTIETIDPDDLEDSHALQSLIDTGKALAALREQK